MDNKLIFENWRRFLTEAELHYSKSAAQEIFNLIQKYLATSINTPGLPKEKRGLVEILQKEIYYSSNPKIKNGATFSYIIDRIDYSPPWDYNKLDDTQKLALGAEWDTESKSYKPEFIESTLNRPMFMHLLINKEGDNTLGGFSPALTEKNQVRFVLVINPKNVIADGASNLVDILTDTIRHELQHVTQAMNGLALYYGEQLAKANGDFSKIKVLTSTKDIKKFGLGREKTGLSQMGAEERKKATQDEIVKSYLGDDFEYETWMSDVISEFIRWSFKQGSLSQASIQWARFTLHNDPRRAKSDQERKNIRQSYIQMVKREKQRTGKSTEELVKHFKSQETFDQIATRLVRELIKGMDVSHPTPKDDKGNQMWKTGEAMTAFEKDSGPDNVRAFQYLSKLRKKEFLGDFLDNLTQRLKKL